MKKNKLKAICFPFAGGNEHVFKPLEKHFSFDMTTVNFPGRGKRTGQPLCKNMTEAVRDFFQQYASLLKGDFFFWGHSLGAVIAYEVTLKIQEKGGQMPKFLIVSGKENPSFVEPEPKHNVSKEEFMQVLRAYGGTAEEVLAHKELMDYFEPIFRADFQIAETYSRSEPAPMNLPLFNIGGKNDKEVSYELLTGWKDYTEGHYQEMLLDGEHFFILDQKEEFAKLVNKIANEFADKNL